MENADLDYLRIQSRVIDFLRFPLAVMVVAIHTYFCESLSNRGVEVPFTGEFAHWLITFFSIYLTDCAVPMFFVISGYLYFLKTPHLTFNIYILKTKGKCINLLIPYLSWNILSIIMEPNIFLSSSLIDKILNFWLLPYNGPLWFMRDLFVIMLFSPLIEYIIRKFNYWPFLFFIGLYVLGIKDVSPGLSIVTYIYFPFGVWLAIRQQNFSEKINYKLIFYIGLIALLLRCLSGVFPILNNLLVVMIWIWCSMLFYFVLSYKIVSHLTYSHYEIIKKLSASSFVIYAMHRLINAKISCIGLIVLDKSVLSGSEAVILYFITISLTVLICYIVYSYVSRFDILSFLLLGSRRRH